MFARINEISRMTIREDDRQEGSLRSMTSDARKESENPPRLWIPAKTFVEG